MGYATFPQEQDPRVIFRRPDLIADAPMGGPRTAVEIKLYRSEQSRIILVEHALQQLSYYLTATTLPKGLLIFTSIIPMQQRERFAKSFPNISIWDQNDLLENAKENSNLLAAFLEFFREIQFGAPADLVLDLSERRDEIMPPPIGQGESLALRLENSSAGRSQKAAVSFEKLCEEALKLLFGGELAGWKTQPRIEQGFQRMDLIARLVPSTLFWVSLERDFRSRYIIFEFKNYKGPITQSEIYTTEKYLFTAALRSIAIVIARSGHSQSAALAMNGALREQGKLILCLSLNELCGMLRDYDLGEDPSNLLIQKLDDMLIGIAR